MCVDVWPDDLCKDTTGDDTDIGPDVFPLSLSRAMVLARVTALEALGEFEEEEAVEPESLLAE